MIDEKTLTRLAETPLYPVARPLPEITKRARAVRRTRRLGQLAVVSTLAAGVVAAGVAVGPLRDLAGGRAVQAAAGGVLGEAGSDCGGGYGHRRTYQDQPKLLYLPPQQLTGPIAGPALVRDDESNCVRPTVAGIWYAMQGGEVTRRFQVTGPNNPDPYDDGDASSNFMGKVEPVAIGDGRGRLYRATDHPDWLLLHWTAADDSTWSADTWGMTREEVLSAVRRLDTSGGELDTSITVPGLPERVDLPTARTPDRHRRYFLASYGHVNQDQGGWSIEVSDTPSIDPLEARFGARPVDINGTTGWWYEKEKEFRSLTWLQDGLSFSISGTVTFEQAVSAARATVKVTPDDPRLIAARER